jgi:hypothetical protein
MTDAPVAGENPVPVEDEVTLDTTDATEDGATEAPEAETPEAEDETPEAEAETPEAEDESAEPAVAGENADAPPPAGDDESTPAPAADTTPPASADATPTDDEATPAPADADATPATDDAASDTTEDPEPEAAQPRSRKALAFAAGIVAVLALVGILLAVFGVFGSSDDTFTDSFNRRGRTTSVAVRGEQGQWSAVSGTWGVQSHAAYVSDPVVGPNLLIAPDTTGDGTLQLRMTSVAPGAGLVFRYQDPQNYWRLVAFPRVLTWQIERVENGRTTFVANTGAFSRVEDGTTIGVRIQGENLDFLVDGKVRQSLRSHQGDLAGSTGLFASGRNADQARWDDFSFDPD